MRWITSWRGRRARSDVIALLNNRDAFESKPRRPRHTSCRQRVLASSPRKKAVWETAQPHSGSRGSRCALESAPRSGTRVMSEEIDKHVLRKYEIQQKLGKGVSNARVVCLCPGVARGGCRNRADLLLAPRRRTASSGKPSIRKRGIPSR